MIRPCVVGYEFRYKRAKGQQRERSKNTVHSLVVCVKGEKRAAALSLDQSIETRMFVKRSSIFGSYFCCQL